MPTIFTHAIAGAAIALVAAPAGRVRTTVALAAAAAILPDFDAIGAQFGFRHGHGMLGHRGVTHSLLFAAAVASGTAALLRGKCPSPGNWRVALAVFAATVSHGVLDAFTSGGGGVAFFAPFDSGRYFFPVTPVRVSPLRASRLFSERGATVMLSEMAWVWLPAGVVALSSWFFRARIGTARAAGSAQSNEPAHAESRSERS